MSERDFKKPHVSSGRISHVFLSGSKRPSPHTHLIYSYPVLCLSPSALAELHISLAFSNFAAKAAGPPGTHK